MSAHTATAAAIVTWEATGEIFAIDGNPPGNVTPPPIGTPFRLVLSFNPALAGPTPTSPAGSGCSVAPLSASFDLGGYSFGATNANVLTHSQLPGTNCGLTAETLGVVEFFFQPTTIGATDPWNLLFFPVFIDAMYHDGVAQDGSIPSVPALLSDRPHSLTIHNGFYEARGVFNPRVLEPSAPVPEPATMTLVGIGLAFAARQRRRARSAANR